MKRTYNYAQSKILQRIGHNVRDAREAKGLSMFELSRMSKIHQQTIKKIEEGKTNPTIVVLEILAEKLQMHICIPKTHRVENNVVQSL